MHAERLLYSTCVPSLVLTAQDVIAERVKAVLLLHRVLWHLFPDTVKPIYDHQNIKEQVKITRNIM